MNKSKLFELLSNENVWYSILNDYEIQYKLDNAPNAHKTIYNLTSPDLSNIKILTGKFKKKFIEYVILNRNNKVIHLRMARKYILQKSKIRHDCYKIIDKILYVWKHMRIPNIKFV